MTDSTIILARISKIEKNVETFSIHVRISTWNQVEETFENQSEFLAKCQNRDNQPPLRRRLIELRSSFIRRDNRVYIAVFFENVTYDLVRTLDFTLPGRFFIPLSFRTITRPLSLSMQIFSPGLGIKRGGERMASFNIGNSCPITIFHRGFDAASNHHRCGGRPNVSACISVFPRRVLLTLRA